MGTISVFLNVTLDGCYAGPDGEIDWFKSIGKDEEFEAQTHQEAQGDSTLVFGRVTYEMMKSFWPTPEAEKEDPHFAKIMRNSPKIVFSRTLEDLDEGPNWKNVTLHREIDAAAIRALGNVTILGSGSIVQQFINQGLLDEMELVLVPLVLGDGKRLFDGVKQSDWTLRKGKPFKNGVVLLDYRRA